MADLWTFEDFAKIQKYKKLTEIATSNLHNFLRPKDHIHFFLYPWNMAKNLPKSWKKNLWPLGRKELQALKNATKMNFKQFQKPSTPQKNFFDPETLSLIHISEPTRPY